MYVCKDCGKKHSFWTHAIGTDLCGDCQAKAAEAKRQALATTEPPPTERPDAPPAETMTHQGTDVTASPSKRSRLLSALDVAAMDALMGGIMAFVLFSVLSWGTKEGGHFTRAPWTDSVILDLKWRTIAIGGVVGGIFGSILRASWGPFMPAISGIFFLSIFEIKPDFSPVLFCLSLALIYGTISFGHKMPATQPVEQSTGKNDRTDDEKKRKTEEPTNESNSTSKRAGRQPSVSGKRSPQPAPFLGDGVSDGKE